MGEIYKIVNDFNDKIYIGKAKNGAEKRWRQHIKQDLYNNQYIHRSMRLYGIEHFHYEIIESGIETVEELNEKEKYYIKYFNSKVPNGYNERDGGDGGDSSYLLKWCEEHPIEVKINRDKAREKAHLWQKENPDLFKSIIKENQKKASEKRKIPVKCIETNIIYESATQAAKENNLAGPSHIIAVCKGKRKTAGGFHWSYMEEE